MSRKPARLYGIRLSERRGRDLNPRDETASNGFRDREKKAICRMFVRRSPACSPLPSRSRQQDLTMARAVWLTSADHQAKWPTFSLLPRCSGGRAKRSWLVCARWRPRALRWAASALLHATGLGGWLFGQQIIALRPCAAAGAPAALSARRAAAHSSGGSCSAGPAARAAARRPLPPR